jgi:hypothetical protein
VAAFRSVWARGAARVHSFGNPYGKEFVMHLVAAARRLVGPALAVGVAAGLAGACNSAPPLEPLATAAASDGRVQSIAPTGKHVTDSSVSRLAPRGDATVSTGHSTPWF